jgi:hypothetical protein
MGLITNISTLWPKIQKFGVTALLDIGPYHHIWPSALLELAGCGFIYYHTFPTWCTALHCIALHCTVY